MESVVKSADRVVAVLSALAEMPVGLTFTDLLVKLELPRSSLHALLQTLIRANLVVYEPETKLYHYGPKLWELSMAYYHRIHLVPIAWPYLQAIRDRMNQTVQMAILEGREILYVAKIESTRPLQLVSHVGSRLPAYATGLGKALLASLSSVKIKELWQHFEFYRYTPHTIDSYEGLLSELMRTRERGYAIDEGEYSPDVRCVAYPILGYENVGVAAISVTMSADQFNHAVEIEMAELLQKAARHISVRVGSTNPDAWKTSGSDGVPVRATLL
ncbi:MAG: IclR family transcriptional regulator [Firmicutes bacterium]|nr:IclR family transcriptional regulator [Bacillota bacterium]